MKKLIKCNLLASLFATVILSVSTPSLATESNYTNYVTDSIEIPLRSKPGYKYKIIRMIRSGTKVTIQKVNNNGWAKLTLQHKGKSIEGWMPTSVLQNMPIAKTLLKQQIQKTSRIEKKLNQQKQEKKVIAARLAEADTELKRVKQENFELSKQLEEITKISGNSILLNKQNAEFSQQIDRLNSENSIMKEQLSQAGDVVQRQWFLTGGGVLLLGLLLGRLFRMPSKKRRWDSL